MEEGFLNINSCYAALIIVLYLLSQSKLLRSHSSVTKFIPSSLIIGLVVSIVINAIPYKIEFESFSTIAFHIFNLSVISMGLTSTENDGTKTKHKTIWGGIWMTAIFTAILCLQSITGFGSVTLFNAFGENSFFEGYGLLSGHGFAQGSGHSMSIGSIWESKYDLKGAISIGLTFSAIGYLIAVVVGIPFTKWFLMKSNPSLIHEKNDEPLVLESEMEENGRTKISDYTSNILVLVIIYMLSIFIAFFLRDVVLKDWLQEYNFAQTLANIIMGLIFVIGLAMAIIFKAILFKIKVNSVLNNQIQKRYTSSLIDLLIISTFLSIKYAIISDVGIPIIMVIVFNTLITCFAFYMIHIKSRANYLSERVAALLGTTFGSLANGLFLLKILDPKIKSPVYYELALMNFYSAFTLGHIMLIIFAIGEWNNLGAITGIYFITLILSLIVARFVEVKLNN